MIGTKKVRNVMKSLACQKFESIGLDLENLFSFEFRDGNLVICKLTPKRFILIRKRERLLMRIIVHGKQEMA